VFEHVPDYRRGFQEVHRVLKKGGYHVFSIPYHFDRKTRDLFEMDNGKRRLHEPVEYHGDPVRGTIPCFTHFGYDLIDFLDNIGFESRIDVSRFVDEERWRTYESFTFVTRKK
jgi:SAM-dependent methyltransferase